MKKLIVALLSGLVGSVWAADAYLESNGTQAIETDWFCTPKTKIVADFAYTAVTPLQQRVFGASDENQLAVAVYINGGGSYAWAYQDDSGNWTSTDITATTDRRVVTLDSANSSVELTLVASGATSYRATIGTTRTKTANRALALFANARGRSAGYAEMAHVRLYSCQIFEDGVKVRDYKPVLRNGVAGLWDSVGTRFYTSAVGDAFTLGGDYETMQANESVWTGTSASFSSPDAWQDGAVPGDGSALVFAGSGGMAANDLAATFGDVTFAAGAGSYLVAGVSFTGSLKNASDVEQRLSRLTRNGALAADVGGGLTLTDVTVNGSFLPRGTGAAVTLTGENTFAGNLSLLGNPLEMPRTYRQSGWSKNLAGTADDNVQVGYWLRGTGKNTFTGGLEDFTGGQRGDVTILEGDNTFGGNVQMTGNDGHFVVRGNLTAQSMLCDNNHGWNSRVIVEQGGSLHVRTGLQQTSNNGFHLYLDGPLTVDGELKLVNDGCHLEPVNGTVLPGVRVTAGSAALGAMASSLTIPMDIGTGGLLCANTKLGGEIGAATVAGFSLNGKAVMDAATTLRTATVDGTPADITLAAAVTGAAPLTKTGAGRLLFATTAPEGYTGAITVTEGSFGYGFTGTAGAQVALAAGTTLYVPAGAEVTYPSLSLADGVAFEYAVTPNGSGTLVLPNGRLPSSLTVRFTGSEPPVGAVLTLVKGANLADASGVSVVASGFDGVLSVDGGDLIYTVTQSDYAALSLVWAGTGGTAPWDAATANWKNDGTPALFEDFARVMFDGTDSAAVVEVAEGLTPGAIVFDTAKDYTLTGGRLNGNGTLTVKGGADVTLDSALDAQPIVIEQGVLRPGANLVDDGTGLGSAGATITVKPGATFDINSTTNTVGRALTTHNKTFKIAGEGFNGQGAIANNSAFGNTDGRIHTIELVDDATVTAFSRWDMRQRNDGANTTRPQVNGTNATLTVKGVGGNNVCMIDADIKLKKAMIVDDGVWSLEGTAEEVITDGVELHAGLLQFWNHATKPFTARVTAMDPNSRIGNGNGTTTVTGPIEILAGAKLSFQRGGTTVYAAEVTGDGNAEVKEGTQLFQNRVTTPFTTVGGFGLFDNKHATGDGSKTPVVTGGYCGFAPSTRETYSGYTFTGTTSFIPSRTGASTTEAVIEDTTVDLTTISMGHPGQQGFATFGAGTTVNVQNVFLGDNGTQPADATLTIGTGSTLTMAAGGDGMLLGRWSGLATNVHKVVVNGGTLDMTAANPPRVGYDTRAAEFLVKDGLAKLPGVSLRYHKEHNMAPIVTPYTMNGYSYEVFGMSGGTVELAGDFTTERTYPYLPQIWLGGGTLKSMADWATDFYQVATFETWGDPRDEARGSFTLDTNGQTVNFRSALQGNANVTLTGTGNFVADYNVQGGVSGHWTIENTGTANLKNAAAFADGLTLAEGTMATIDIGARDQYASLAIACNANADLVNNEFKNDNFWDRQSVFPSLFTKDFQVLPMLPATPTYTAFRQEAEFYVAEADDYTFAIAYDDRGDVVVDGTRVCYNNGWNAIGVGHISLNVGWHRLSVTCQDAAGNAGPSTNTDVSPDPAKWKAAGMACGWHKGAASTTSVNDFQPINATTLKMRPVSSVRWNHRYTNDAVPDDWHSNDSYTFSMVTNSLRAIHNTENASLNNGEGVFIYNDGSLNSWTFWSYVEPEDAGTWSFEGVFDDRLGVKIDGKVVFENTSWNQAKTMVADVSAGWHKFKVTTSDAGGGWSWSGVANYGAGLYVKRPSDAAKVPFDERNIRMTAEPYGFIGGLVDVKEGATLLNVSSTPCDLTGTLTGSGTLDGKYKLLGTWSFDLTANKKDLPAVKWANPDPAALAKATFKVVCDEKPALARYVIGCAPLGLESLSSAELQDRLDCQLFGESYDGLTLAIRNNQLVLENARPAGTTLFLR